MPPSALHRLDENSRGLAADRPSGRARIAPWHLIEAVHQRRETGDVLLLAPGADRRQRAPVEGALEGDHAVALGMAGLVVVLAHQLEAALHRLNARIGEKDGVGEAVGDEPVCQPLLTGDAEQVRGVPQLAGLLAHRRDELGVGVAEAGHRDARGEVEELTPVGGIEEGALATLERQVGAAVGRHDGSDHECSPDHETAGCARGPVLLGKRTSMVTEPSPVNAPAASCLEFPAAREQDVAGDPQHHVDGAEHDGARQDRAVPTGR